MPSEFRSTSGSFSVSIRGSSITSNSSRMSDVEKKKRSPVDRIAHYTHKNKELVSSDMNNSLIDKSKLHIFDILIPENRFFLS